ncbi:trace amine-associated receptor 13c-like [Sinocyclocheilus anshuiensis]|uniref:trace amine-associated receptor 13c-like n=1 Tax=Sinocyclocheilus anshuiensis TaxID=1608454 RepID=UPI0007B99467|nr:PREDICTED: trace amine-associated receptor 13c-like [Sinocyclocheilus anshuiensis]
MAYETEDHEIQYCFPDIISSCPKGKRSSHEYNIMYVLILLLSAWTVFLNLLVIISISHFKKLHTPTNLLILSLAVSDMFIGLIVIPIEAINLIETCWYFGHTFCGLFVVIIGLLLSVSLGNLVLIAIDRYVAVCHPLLYPHKITMTKTLMGICIYWFTCFIGNFAFAINYRYFDTAQADVCYGGCYLNVPYSLSIMDLFISFLIPCTMIIALYLRIFYVVHQQVKIINSLMKSGKCEMEDSVKRKSESKAALTLGIIMTVYLLCYIPFYILYITAVTTPVISILTWIFGVFLNPALNGLMIMAH